MSRLRWSDFVSTRQDETSAARTVRGLLRESRAGYETGLESTARCNKRGVR